MMKDFEKSSNKPESVLKTRQKTAIQQMPLKQKSRM